MSPPPNILGNLPSNAQVESNEMQPLETFVELSVENLKTTTKLSQSQDSASNGKKSYISPCSKPVKTQSKKKAEDENPSDCSPKVGEHYKDCWKSAALDTFSKRIRKKIHLKYYTLGCFIQQHEFVVCVLSILVLILCLIPLKTKKLKVNTEIEELWVASTGRLHEELKYSYNATGKSGFGGEQDYGYEVLMQVVQNGDDNILTKELLIEHLDILKRVKNEVFVTYHGEKWTLPDLCDRYEPSYYSATQDWARIIDNLSPCLIMTPLDCFWEGSAIASYATDSVDHDYKETDPQTLVDFVKNSTEPGDQDMYENIKRFVDKIGLGKGYVDRPCFGANISKCPTHVTKDVPANLNGGCYGVAKNYMRWPEDLIVSDIVKNETGYIKRAKAIQSVIQLKSAKNLKQSLPFDKQVALSSVDFNSESAETILDMWKQEFTEFVSKSNVKYKYKSKMLAFSRTSFKGLINDLSNIKKKNSYVGLAVLTCYAMFTLKRWTSCVYSYGFVGLVGVGFSVLSVFSGIGLSYLANMNLSVISVQVLPYLALGLGLDYMFLLARTYLFVCDNRQFKCHQIVGTCLAEVGFDITVATVTNVIAFLMASLVPIGAVQTFAKQAAIIYAVNWFTVTFTFSSFLSFDVKRQKNEHYDILLCCRSNCIEEKEEVERINNNGIPDVVQSNFQYIFPGTADTPPTSAEVIMKIQAGGGTGQQIVTENDNMQSSLQHPNYRTGCTPQTFKLSRASKARRQPSHRVFNVAERDRERKLRKDRKKKELDQRSEWKDFLFKLSLTYFAQRYYGRWLVKTPVKGLVLTFCVIQLIISAYGTMNVENGLQIDDMLPKGTYQHEFMVARQKYFSYYHIFIVIRNTTDGNYFDYSSKKNQKLLYEFYNTLAKVKYMVKVYDTNPFWLSIFREWLQETLDRLKKEMKHIKGNDLLNNCTKCEKLSVTSKAIYRLLSTGYDRRMGKIIDRELIDRDGYINPKLFNLALSIWYQTDNLGVWKSEMEILPIPRNIALPQQVPKYPETHRAIPSYTHIPFQVHNLQKNEDYIQLINDVRAICDKFKQKGLESYPTGIPFTYWEQFVNLDHQITISVLVVLVSVFLITFICLLNFKAAFIITIFLGMIFFESYGFVGLCNIKLSAISLIPLMMATAVGTQFVVHSVMAFINTPGSRNERMRGSLEIMFASVLDCSISSIIMIALMTTSEYDFIIKYFVQLMLWIVCTAMINAILVLPVVLSLVGPCPEESHRAVVPTETPCYFVRFPDGYDEWTRPNNSRLSTIPEENSCLSNNSKESQRPLTPFVAMSGQGGGFKNPPTTHVNSLVTAPLNSDNITLEDYNEDEDDYNQTTFMPNSHSRRVQTPAMWSPHASLKPNCRHSNKPFNCRSQNNQRTVPRCCNNSIDNSQITGKSCQEKCSNQRQNSSRMSDNNTTNAPATVIHVRSSDDNRVTTKLKATWSFEYETSHPFSPHYDSQYNS